MANGPARLVRAVAMLAAALVAAAPAAEAKQIEGIRFVPAVSAPDVDLALHGVGVMRWRSVLKVYAAALYLAPGVDPAQALGDVPKRLEIEYFYGFDAADFVRVTKETLPRNASAPALEAMRPRVEALNALYRDVEAGDRYAITYVPGRGTELSLNGAALGLVPGADLARALFAIWLGEDPLDASLKAQLLGAR